MQKKANMPWLVYVGLLGINSRTTALIYMWICIVAGSVSVVLSWFYILALIGSVFYISALWYGYALAWVDNYSGWD